MNARRNISDQPVRANISALVAQKFFPRCVTPASRPHVIKKKAAKKAEEPGRMPESLLTYSKGYSK